MRYKSLHKSISALQCKIIQCGQSRRVLPFYFSSDKVLFRGLASLSSGASVQRRAGNDFNHESSTRGKQIPLSPGAYFDVSDLDSENSKEISSTQRKLAGTSRADRNMNCGRSDLVQLNTEQRCESKILKNPKVLPVARPDLADSLEKFDPTKDAFSTVLDGVANSSATEVATSLASGTPEVSGKSMQRSATDMKEDEKGKYVSDIKTDPLSTKQAEEFGYKYEGPEPTAHGDWAYKGKVTDF